MRTRLAASLLAVVAVACQSNAGPSDSPMSEAQRTAIADTVTALTRAVIDGGNHVDADATFQRFAGGDDAAHMNMGTRYTRDSLVATYRTIFGRLERQQIDVGTPTVTVLGPDAAVLSATGQFSATPKTGAVLASPFAWTFVWARRDGTWSLVHSHQSTPQALGPPPSTVPAGRGASPVGR